MPSLRCSCNDGNCATFVSDEDIVVSKWAASGECQHSVAFPATLWQGLTVWSNFYLDLCDYSGDDAAFRRSAGLYDATLQALAVLQRGHAVGRTEQFVKMRHIGNSTVCRDRAD